MELTASSPMDWEHWQGEILATLLFIVKDGKILLIEKKRGIGAGKVNGPGGKIDPGESPLECAIRETQEELLITPLAPRKMGELWFSMTHIPDIHCHVFMAEDFTGVPCETDEAVPLWTAIDGIPYERMWEDDRHWLPQMIAGETFLGKFRFHDEEIRWMDIVFGVTWDDPARA
jgi:8-oxo-dGTP diphosphatase